MNKWSKRVTGIVADLVDVCQRQVRQQGPILRNIKTMQIRVSSNGQILMCQKNAYENSQRYVAFPEFANLSGCWWYPDVRNKKNHPCREDQGRTEV